MINYVYSALESRYDMFSEYGIKKKGGDTLSGTAQAGQAADDTDPLAATGGQTAYTSVDGLEVGHAHRRILLHIENTVHQHHREAVGNQRIKPLSCRKYVNLR